MTVVIIWWCRLYTAIVPVDVGERRRRELESHLWEAQARGQSPMGLLARAMAGAMDDLYWSHLERSAAGLPPVVLTRSGSAALAFALVFGSYAGSWGAGHDVRGGVPWFAVLALGLLVASWVDGWRRTRPHSEVSASTCP